ncbi:MAG TPA: hypothetical protein DEB09_02390 [Candidatus Magasanikbacteria bacterium]|nr:hypothetical protein [Candidatus Magasanikbacteria bacterium]
MDEKKSFFDLMSRGQSFAFGIIGGVLVLCTIGFFITLGILLSGGSSTTETVDNKPAVVQNDVDGAVAPSPTVVKSDKPVVELFVMSYCPYGLQMEKAYLPAWELLKNKADISLKFVSYAMHGKKEIDENTRQYCIGQDSKDKLIAYLKCFVAEDNSAKCLSAVKLTDEKLASCVNSTDKKYKITEQYNDKSTWLSGRYPIYGIDGDLNTKYDVQGSPTLVINGTQVNVARTPEAVKQVICAAFNKQPEECKKVLSNSSYSAGFGLTASDNAANVECGV